MKKIILSKIFLLISFVVLFSLSCKKEQATDDERLIRDAKSWYQNATKKSTFLMRSSENKKEDIKQELDWSNAKAYILDDATDVLGVPMKIVRNGVNATGSYLMCITKVNGKFKPLVLYNEKEDYFSGTLDNKEMQKAYTEAVTITVSKKKALSQPSPKGRLSLEQIPQPPICIDWYWTEITYDYQGNIISIEENYLYSICYPNGGNPPGGGGGGGGIPPDEDSEPTIEWGQPDDTNFSQTNTVTSDTTGSIVAGWYCYSAHGGAIQFKSYERIYYSISRTTSFHIVWKAYSVTHLDHISMASEGFITGQDISSIYAFHIDNTSNNVAKIKLVFKDRREYVQNRTTKIRYSPDITATNAWNKVQLGLIDD